MKKSKILLLAAILSLTAAFGAGSVCAFADTQEKTDGALPHLVVIGSAKAYADADECIFHGCIDAVASDMNAAEKQCSEIFEKVKETFKPYGEASENRYEVYPLHGAEGYAATRFLTFTTDKIESLGEIRAALAASGVCRLDGVTYRLKDDSQLKLQALRLAVENAKEKAAALGAEGKLVNVEEICCRPSFRNAEGDSAPSGVIYTVSVRAVFASRPKKEEPTKDRQPEEQSPEENS